VNKTVNKPEQLDQNERSRRTGELGFAALCARGDDATAMRGFDGFCPGLIEFGAVL
jgi:hypothetical protein